MKKLFVLSFLLVSTALFQPLQAYAKAPHHNTHSHEQSPRESDLQEHGSYTNKKGQHVHSPAHSKSGGIPNGASAQCGDNTYSFSKSHRGTCSHHGGVAQWIN